MPIWLDVLGWLVKGLVFLYGHPKVAEKLAKYTPITPEENPSPWRKENPNNNDADHGGRSG